MMCQECRAQGRLRVGKRYRVVVEGLIGIAVMCDEHANPQPPKPRWLQVGAFRRKDYTGSVA